MAGTFEGDVEVRWLVHDGADRDMALLSDFAYVDPAGLRWDVPAGSVVNGASIPRVFWTSFGPPFVGDYRRASVVHDHFCVVRTRTSNATHRMFRDACISGGVSSGTAAVMYGLVNAFGPHWQLPQAMIAAEGAAEAIPLTRNMIDDTSFELQRWIEQDNPDLDEIDRRIDEMAPLITVPGFTS